MARRALMRVAHVHPIAGIGGSERHLLTLLPALAAEGVEPRFVGLDAPGPGPDAFYSELDAAGVPYARLAGGRDLDPLLPTRLARAVRGLGADLVHTHLVHGDVYGTLAATLLRLPVVSTKHNDDPFRTGPYRHLERALVARARAVIAITEALGRFLVARAGLPARKIEVIRYGLDAIPPAWAPNPPVALEGRRVLLACARLVPQKGLDTLVRALPAVRAAHADAVVLVAGEGPERPRLAELARELGVEDALLLPGRAGDVGALYRGATAYVLPSRWEGFGLVMLEAMLAGLPVVASAVSSVPEIVVDGETGLLVPVDDPAALAAAIIRLLDDPEGAARLGAAGLARARASFSAAEMAHRTADVYRR
jgi:glycosyltransferase involved in cell wall biosynthesis